MWEVHSCVRAVDLESFGWGFLVPLHIRIFMLDYFREGREEVKGDESYHVAIRVEVEPMPG
ncbi:MAG: hypothetical protein CME33_26545 [Gimesia sp.]|nr:hypothetical protein [Gimesia sp.]